MVTMKPSRLNRVALLLALGWLTLIALTLDPSVDDFERFWQAASDLTRYGDPYVTRADYFYPPFFIYLLQPFGSLEHADGQRIWFALNSLFLAGYIWLCIWMSGSLLARRYWGAVVLGVLLAPPTRLSLQLGQVSMMVGFLMLSSFALARRAAPLSGLLLALATLVRLHPAFLGLYYLLRRPRQVAWWTAAMGVGLLAGSLLWWGTGPYASYLQTIVQTNLEQRGAYPYAAEHNISLFGFWSRLLTTNPFTVPIGHAPLLATVLTGITSVGVLAVCFWIGRGGEGGPTLPLTAHLQFHVWMCGMMLLFPTNGYYNLVLLVLPVLLVLRALEQEVAQGADMRRIRVVRVWLVLAVALACIPPGWTRVHPLVYETLHMGWGTLVLTPAFYGLCLSLALLAWLARTHNVRHNRWY